MAYIDSHRQENIGLPEIAEEIKVSEQCLCRLFCQCLDMTPFDYLIRSRIKKAKKTMADKSLLIKDISRLSGFSDVSYFCHVFKKYEKISPKRFRDLFY